MPAARSPSLLRRGVRLANLNAALWSVGAGLAPTLLITYLAMAHGARGIEVSWVLAAPRLAGPLRLLVPTAIRWVGSRKRVCVASYAGSALLLAALPSASAPGVASSHWPGLSVLIFFWTGYQVLEYFGTTALWSWLGDLYPPRVRGSLIGVREKWLTRGQIAGALAGFLLTSFWGDAGPSDRWLPLAASTGLGAVFMGAAVAPLVRMPNATRRFQARDGFFLSRAIGGLWAGNLLRLLGWSMLLSVANGIAAAARGVFPYRVLGLSYPVLLTMNAGMRVGQSLAAPALGRQIDRTGPRRVLAASQAIVATSPLFFLLASPTAPWWFVGAYVSWIAYAGLNVGLDAMKIEVAPPTDNAPALSLYYAANDVVSGVTILLGGVLLQPLLEDAAATKSAYLPALVLGFTLRLIVLCLTPLLPGRRLNAEPAGPRPVSLR